MKNIKMLSTGTALTILAAAFAGCTGPGQASKTTAPAPVVATLSGKVVETADAGGYTYINLEKDGKNTWVAAPVMKVSVGQELELLSGGEMANFTSKTLNRTFEKIIFSGGLAKQETPAPAAETATGTGPEESAEAIMIGTVLETMNAAQYTYLRVEKDGKASWAAVPNTRVAVGDEIELQPGTAMGKFTSKTLNRTFNSIYFASGLKVTLQKNPAAAEPSAADAAIAQLPQGHPKIDGTPAADAAAAPLPEGHPKIDAAKAAAPAPAAATLITGKVVETTDAGGYTYICLEKDGQKSWAAVPTMKVSIGQELALYPGAVMSNFVSKTLNRTFDKIVFSSGPATAK